jgi:sulfite exporter TauE/SafE
MSAPKRRSTACTLALMEPRCTGMCGALATSAPSVSNSAQEKSRRSLMFTEWAVFCSV